MTSQPNQSLYFAGLGFDGRRVGAAAVEREHAMRRGIVDDAIWISSNFDFFDRLQCLRVKHGDRPVPPVAGEAASQIVGYGYAVHAQCVWNLPCALTGIGVKNHHSSCARNVKATSGTVYIEVIPAAFTSDVEFLQ